MLAQRAQLRTLADTSGMALLHGSELNIAPDGSVDWDDDFLSGSTCASHRCRHEPAHAG
jgi:DNA polymerase (family 10)